MTRSWSTAFHNGKNFNEFFKNFLQSIAILMDRIIQLDCLLWQFFSQPIFSISTNTISAIKSSIDNSLKLKGKIMKMPLFCSRKLFSKMRNLQESAVRKTLPLLSNSKFSRKTFTHCNFFVGSFSSTNYGFMLYWTAERLKKLKVLNILIISDIQLSFFQNNQGNIFSLRPQPTIFTS